MNATLSVTERFSLSVDGLYRAVAARIAGGGLEAWLITLICGRLRRIEARVMWLVAAIQTGQLRPAQVRRAVVQGAGRGRAKAPRLPCGFAWLIKLVPYQAAGFGSQLRHLFADPEMAALIASTPRMVRALRPLFWMLGIEPALLKPVVASAPELVAVVDAIGTLPGEPGDTGSVARTNGGTAGPVVGDGRAVKGEWPKAGGGFYCRAKAQRPRWP